MQLLVSVKSAQEAENALAGGAGLIDVKAPARGSLGRADDRVIREVVRKVDKRVAVSAALGEWLDDPLLPAADGLRYVKWGLSRCGRLDWPEELRRMRNLVAEQGSHCTPVAVAYADWQRAESPCPESVLAYAQENEWPIVLLDTFVKDGSWLGDWISGSRLENISKLCRESGVRLALAGSLDYARISSLNDLMPDWFAVRGAACLKGDRNGPIDSTQVRNLVSLLGAPKSIAENSRCLS